MKNFLGVFPKKLAAVIKAKKNTKVFIKIKYFSILRVSRS